MPNTPAIVGFAATSMIANEFVNEKQKNGQNNYFQALGLLIGLKMKKTWTP